MTDHARRFAAEALGTGLLVATVVGSAIMADRLTADDALVLLANALATGGMLVVLITILGPVSGAHLNPAVTLAFRLRGDLGTKTAAIHVLAQAAGGVAGLMLAHAMFDLPVLQTSTSIRAGAGQWLAEGVATFGLLFTILAALRFRPETLPWMVATYIVSAYWFTSSTAFANPAVVMARSLTDTFAGIRPGDVPPFIVAELGGAVLAVAFAHWLLKGPTPNPGLRVAE